MSVLVNAYCTRQHLPAMTFSHQQLGLRDISDPELSPHLQGFQGYIMQKGEQEMTQTKYHLLRHIQRVNHHCSFDIEPSAFDALAQWAFTANAVLFFQDGTVRSPNGEVLFFPDGQSPDVSAQVPFLAESYQRQTRSEQGMAERNLPVPNLPPLPCEHELCLRSADAIFHRAMALFVVAVRAESLATGDRIGIDMLKTRIPAGFRDLSPAEHAFLHGEAHDDSQIAQFAWRYESAALLLWVLGVLPDVPFPTAICDVPKVAKISLDWADWQEDVQVKPISEVLDCLDFHYRLHWLCRQAGQQGEIPPADMDSGVVYERHYALNWLVGFEGAEWDDVDTPT